VFLFPIFMYFYYLFRLKEKTVMPACKAHIARLRSNIFGTAMGIALFYKVL